MAADPANKQYGTPQFGLDTSAYGSTGAPGTVPPGAGLDTGIGGIERDTGTLVTVSIAGASTVNADTVRVGAADTLVPSQLAEYGPATDPLTGIGSPLGDTGAGRGTASSPAHPNAVTPGSLGAQAQAARQRS